MVRFWVATRFRSYHCTHLVVGKARRQCSSNTTELVIRLPDSVWMAKYNFMRDSMTLWHAKYIAPANRAHGSGLSIGRLTWNKMMTT